MPLCFYLNIRRNVQRWAVLCWGPLVSWLQWSPDGCGPDWESPRPFIQWWTVRPLSMLHPIPPNFHLLQTYSFLSPRSSKNSPGSRGVAVFCVPPSPVPFLSLSLTGILPRSPSHLRRSQVPQECAGACNRLCRGHWVVRLTETSQPHSVLAAEWRSAWGSSPTRGRCQIPTVALHNHSHTGPGAGRRDWEGGGGRVGQRNGEVYLIQYQNCHIWLSIANL